MRILAKHQRTAFYYSKTVSHPAYFLDMRLGKARLTIFDILSNNTLPALIVGPYSALYGWKQELINTFNVDKNDIHLIHGTKKQRQESLFNQSPFQLVNRENHLSFPEIVNKKFKSVVYDESTSLKNPTTKMSQHYTKGYRDVNRRYILTGTPMPESELDIFQQLKFLDPKILGFKDYWHFRHELFIKYDAHSYCISETGLKFLTDRISKFCITISQADAGLYNKVVYERRVFRLSNKTMKAYKNLCKNFVLQYDNIMVATDYNVSKYSLLRQLCSGFILNKSVYGDTIKPIDGTKLEVLKDLLLGELKNNKIIIWAVHTFELHHIGLLLDRLKIKSGMISGTVSINERDSLINNFQGNKIQVLYCQPECLKYGATINKADVTVYFSSPLGLETRLQTEKRMNNPYVAEVDLIIDLTAEGTIEEVIVNSIIRKESKQETLLNMSKHIRGKAE